MNHIPAVERRLEGCLPITPVEDLGELAALYGRMSTSKQENSLDVQDEKCRAYCQLKGLAVASVFTDPATSGRIPVAEREGAGEMMRAIALSQGGSRPIRHLVVAKLDRLGRNCRDLLETVERLTELGVTVHFVDIGGDSITNRGPLGKLFLSLLAAFAEFEVAMIRDRTQQTMGELRRQGRPTGGTVPYGWQVQGTRWIPHPEEQRQLALMRDLETAGWNCNRIMRDLNDRGIPSKTGKAWTYAAVQSALTAKINQPLAAAA